MTRWERLVGLLLLLQTDAPTMDVASDTRPWLTATKAAGHFGVSRRTILRDIAALGELGVPIASRDGARGGYALAPGYVPQTLPLTLRETLLLLLALSGIEQLSGTPFGNARVGLTAKLRALIDPKLIDGADAILERVAISVPDRSQHPTPFLDTLFLAAQNERWVTAIYRSETGPHAYTFLPINLTVGNGFWYISAELSLKEGVDDVPRPRNFRADRFVSVEVRNLPPAGVILTKDPTLSLPYDHPSHPEVIARLTEKGLRRAESDYYVGKYVRREPEGGGTLQFHFPPDRLEFLTGYFLGYGADVEVLAPEPLRRSIADLAQKVVCLYSER